jgi:hypothetical protein
LEMKLTSSFGPYTDLVFPNSTIQSALLVQRDIALDIPISHILLPAINLTSSWFWTRQYAVDNITAISSMFDMGYRRFELDLFWDNTTSSFQLCPEQIVSNTTSNSTTIITTTITHATRTVVSSTTSSFNTTITSTFTTSPPTTVAAPDPTALIPLPNNYSCAPGANFQTLLNTLESILSRTDNNLKEAGLMILVLNLNTLPSLAGNNTVDLSTPTDQSLSQQINATLGDWLYTPATLAVEREDINSTFLADKANPIIGIPNYYDLIIDNISQVASTPNGWPSTRHLFEIQGRRILIGFGSINVATDIYDISQDSNIIFPPATFGGQDQLISSTSIQNTPSTCLGPAGLVFGPQGQEDFNSTSLSGNTSFALSQDPTPQDPLSYDSVEAIVNCGLSPLIDSPMQNTSSGNMSPYQQIAATIWSWLPSEPQNTSLPQNGTTNVFACAALGADTGQWSVVECNTHLQIACRVNSSLYNVKIPRFWVVS